MKTNQVTNEIESIIDSNPGISEEMIYQMISENEKHHFYCFHNGEIFRAVLNKIVIFLLKEKNYHSKQDIEYVKDKVGTHYMISRWYKPYT